MTKPELFQADNATYGKLKVFLNCANGSYIPYSMCTWVRNMDGSLSIYQYMQNENTLEVATFAPGQWQRVEYDNLPFIQVKGIDPK